MTDKTTWGGARDGAGRKKNPIVTLTIAPTGDPMLFLLTIMNDSTVDAKLRIDAAKALLPYVHRRASETGKKNARQQAAAEAGTGKFGPGKTPALTIINPKGKP